MLKEQFRLFCFVREKKKGENRRQGLEMDDVVGNEMRFEISRNKRRRGRKTQYTENVTVKRSIFWGFRMD